MPTRGIVVLVSLLLATPVIMSWLWLVIMPLRVAKHCPQECWCDVGGYFVDCSRKSLHNIPSIYLTHVQDLVLDDNNIPSLENDSFVSKGLTDLNFLSLDGCGLQTIELGAFNGLTKLTYLSMKWNWIGEITRGTFEVMSGLEYLGLDYNKIERLDADMFLGLINLQHINLEGNELLVIHPDIFVGLPKLERLDLGANNGLKIPTDHHFITSHSLKVLDIHKCNISSVSVQTFANISALEVLNLRFNNLTSIDKSILISLPKLHEMYVYDNPLQCDCQLKEVWLWCEDHNLETDSYVADLKCYSPMKGHIMWQWVLEELQCEQDNISNTYESEQKRYNLPDEENESRRTNSIMLLVLILVYLFLSIIGTIGNILILNIVTCNKDMRTVSNMYIINLAISDLIFLTLPFADIYFILGHMVNKELRCTLFPFCYRMSVGLSAYSVVVLSIQRYRITVKPFHFLVSSKSKWRVTVPTICGVWIVAALFAIPSARSSYLCPGNLTEPINIAFYKRVFTFELFVFCVLPLFVIAFSYIMTARHLIKSVELVSEERQNPQLNKRKNVAKYVMGLTLVFLISYVPYHVFWAIIVFNSGRKTNLSNLTNDPLVSDFPLTILVSYCLFLMNSALNPVALFCTSSLFRKHFKCYLSCCCKANSPPTDIVRTRRN